MDDVRSNAVDAVKKPDEVGMAKEENFSRRQKLLWNHMDAFSSRVDDDERAERYVEKILKKIEKKRAYEQSLKRLSMLERDTGNYQTTMIPTQGRFEEEIGNQQACKCQSYDNFQMEAKLTIPNEDIPKNATLRGIRIEDEYGNICLQIPNPVLHCNSHGDNTFEKINIQVPCDYQNQGKFLAYLNRLSLTVLFLKKGKKQK